MFWRILGIVSLAWGILVFFILSTTPLPGSQPQVTISPSAEFTIYILSFSWLISSSLVKVGLILKRHWVRVSIISCVCFIFLLINMGLVQAQIGDISPPSKTPGSIQFGSRLVCELVLDRYTFNNGCPYGVDKKKADVGIKKKKGLKRTCLIFSR